MKAVSLPLGGSPLLCLTGILPRFFPVVIWYLPPPSPSTGPGITDQMPPSLALHRRIPESPSSQCEGHSQKIERHILNAYEVIITA